MTEDIFQWQPLLNGETEEDWDPKPVANGHRKIGNGHVVSTDSENGMVRIKMPEPSREEPKYPGEKLKTLLMFLFAVFSCFLNTTSLALVHEKVPDRNTYGPLPDVFLDNVPESDWGLDVSEILIIVSTTSCMLLLFFHKHRLIVMRRIFFILGLLYMMRSVTMYVTALPVASRTYYCSEKTNQTTAATVLQRSVRMLVGMGLSINGQHVYCGDYIYSGHTVILTMAYLIIQEYTPRRCFLIHWASWLVSITGVFFMMMAHGHYSIDVIIAYFVTTRLFYTYHTLANNSSLKQKKPTNYFSRVWWYPIFTHLERNVGGVVPRRYEWPLPWPRHFVPKYPDHDS